jgi:radical SAM protein with 4Fe4S-binding SPASM domain
MANPDPGKGECLLSFPKKVYQSTRDDRTLLFAADRGVLVVVNRIGREILEAGREGDTALSLAKRFCGERPDLAGIVQKVIEPFLKEMVSCGYLLPNSEETGCEESEPADPPGPISLYHLYLHLTDACNLRCLYCYNAKARHQSPGGKKKRSLSSPQWRLVIKEAAKLQAKDVVFTGGEPLCHQDACDLALYAKSEGLKTTLLTNGTLIDAPISQRIAKAFDTVVVSLDSQIKEEHEHLRPGAPFESVIEGIRNLVESRVSSLAIRPVINRVNVNSLPGFPLWAMEELGCYQFHPALYLPNSPREMKELNLLPDPETYWELRSRFLKEIHRLGGIAIDECRPLEISGVCGAGGNVLSVATNGDVYPCQCLHFEPLCAGNVTQQPLEEIMHRFPLLEEFKQVHWPWFDRCGSCLLHTYCTSTCRVFRHTFAGHEDIFHDTLCTFFQKDLDDRMWKEAERVQAAL